MAARRAGAPGGCGAERPAAGCGAMCFTAEPPGPVRPGPATRRCAGGEGRLALPARRAAAAGHLHCLAAARARLAGKRSPRPAVPGPMLPRFPPRTRLPVSSTEPPSQIVPPGLGQVTSRVPPTRLLCEPFRAGLEHIQEMCPAPGELIVC
jgi:hypothetical protein